MKEAFCEHRKTCTKPLSYSNTTPFLNTDSLGRVPYAPVVWLLTKFSQRVLQLLRGQLNHQVFALVLLANNLVCCAFFIAAVQFRRLNGNGMPSRRYCCGSLVDVSGTLPSREYFPSDVLPPGGMQLPKWLHQAILSNCSSARAKFGLEPV